MMYYGAGSAGWFWMALGMIAFWTVAVALVVWAVRSSRHDLPSTPHQSVALNILQERLARGEISNQEYAERRQLIQPVG